MSSFIHLLSGIALILIGVRQIREGLFRSLGDGLHVRIARLAVRPYRSFGVGLALGTLVPSSTSVSMLVTQILQEARLTAASLFPMMLGADVGVTALVLLTSLHVSQASPWLMVVGVGLIQFCRSNLTAGSGRAIFGLSLILMGVAQIEATGGLLSHQPDAIGLMTIAEHYPAALGLMAAALAMALQSSTATILLIGSLGGNEGFTLPLTLCVVLGANLGVTVTRLMIGWRRSEARRLVTASLLNRLLIAFLMLLGSRLILRELDAAPLRYAMKVAVLHSGFNIVAAICGLCLSGTFIALSRRIVAKDDELTARRFEPRYIRHVDTTDAPNMALGQSLREILRAAEIVREMLVDLWRAMEIGDEKMAAAISQRDDQVDLLDKEVKRFLGKLSVPVGEEDVASEQMRQLRFLNEIESIGDIVDKNLCDLVVKKLHNHMDFPDAAWEDLQEFFTKVEQNMQIAEIAFQTRDPKLAAQLLRHKQWLNEHYRRLADRQLNRLADGTREMPEMTAVHLDLLTNLKRINSCLSHVAYAVLPEADRDRSVEREPAIAIMNPIPAV